MAVKSGMVLTTLFGGNPDDPSRYSVFSASGRGVLSSLSARCDCALGRGRVFLEGDSSDGMVRPKWAEKGRWRSMPRCRRGLVGLIGVPPRSGPPHLRGGVSPPATALARASPPGGSRFGARSWGPLSERRSLGTETHVGHALWERRPGTLYVHVLRARALGRRSGHVRSEHRAHAAHTLGAHWRRAQGQQKMRHARLADIGLWPPGPRQRTCPQHEAPAANIFAEL